uniref:Global nitrogen transcriptional regulator n=1 Tax=Polysiphonia sp. TaxID=1967842 RepID=A0A1Z1M4H1_9FLOR|nr:global nitrogen transcriptional regulator [Polysiphonia sp.]
MKWIKFLTINNIPYYIYKIKKEDSIIISNIKNNNNIIIILCGLAYLTQVFTNQELLPVAILDKNKILFSEAKKQQIYHKLVALDTTYVLSLDEFTLKRSSLSVVLGIHLLESYKQTIHKYELTNTIISQKYIKNRILQLIFTICLQFGEIKNQKILIPFHLSQKNIAILTGTSKNSVSKVMKKISKMNIIKDLDKKMIYINNILQLNLK